MIWQRLPQIMSISTVSIQETAGSILKAFPRKCSCHDRNLVQSYGQRSVPDAFRCPDLLAFGDWPDDRRNVAGGLPDWRGGGGWTDPRLSSCGEDGGICRRLAAGRSAVFRASAQTGDGGAGCGAHATAAAHGLCDANLANSRIGILLLRGLGGVHAPVPIRDTRCADG